jgi:hypothetical protein
VVGAVTDNVWAPGVAPPATALNVKASWLKVRAGAVAETFKVTVAV